MIIGVIMAGGVGERFWPGSRRLRPKQLLRLLTDKSLLEETIRRIEPLIPPERVFILTNVTLKGAILNEIPDFPEKNIICEPVGRNTAACLALAEAVSSARFEDPTMAVLTADHVIRDNAAFLKDVKAACAFAEESKGLLTIGIPPTRPETGFGYIEAGEPEGDISGVRIFRVNRFREKPDHATAETYIASGRFYWNSGMFFWKNSVLRNGLEEYLPETMEGINSYRAALGTSREDAVLAEVFPKLPAISIDYALLEKSDRVYAIAADFGWDDLGTWNALERWLPGDESGNILVGNGKLVSSSNCIVYNPPGEDAPLVASFGIDDMLIVVDGDVVLICPKSRAPELKKLVGEIRASGLDQYL